MDGRHLHTQAAVAPRAPLAERIRDGEQLVGTVIGAPDPGLAELTAAPFDFVWLDLEHSPLSLAAVHELAVAVQSTGAACLVRLPSPTTEPPAAILDSGVDGIVVPRAERVEDVRAVVARLHHPPAGTRGFAHRRATGWGRRERPLHAPACVVQVESRAALGAVEQLASVEGVDATDLALDLRTPLALDDATLSAAVRAVQAACERAGVGFGIAASGPPEVIAACLGPAGGTVVYSADVRILAAAVDRIAGAVRAALEVQTAASKPPH
jgi:2-keto-3-deoxy-L-rhamnonate aldolase RhmA